MSKFLTLKEAEEIINTMLTARGLRNIVISEDDRPTFKEERFTTKEFHYKIKSFLWFKWKTKIMNKHCWYYSRSLITLIHAIEEHLRTWDITNEVQWHEIEKIRERHAARVLDAELRKS